MAGEFQDRTDAGRQLTAGIAELHADKLVVLGLPRGGVPVAAEVAALLHAPLDIIVVRKLGVPFQPEVAMGAIGEGGVRVLDQELITALGITPAAVNKVEQGERKILASRLKLFRTGAERSDLTGRTALIVDDGIATGATATAACRVVRALGAARVIMAAPVGGPDAVRRLQEECEVVCPLQPQGFRAVGVHYQDFDQTPESEVIALLAEAHQRLTGEHP